MTRTNHDRAVGELLRAVCRDDGDVTAAASLPADAVVAAARHHRVSPLAHVRLRETAPAVAEALRADRDAAKSLHIRAGMLLAHVSEVLADVPWVVFKGPVLSELAHPVPGVRPYGDLDLLVAPQDLRAVSRALLAAGWEVGDYEDMLRNPQTPGEMHWFTPAGIQVDLHWAMINMGSRRRLFRIDTDALLARRRRVRIGLGQAWALDEADALVHVALHAALAGGNRLAWMVDVDQLSRQVGSWRVVAARATEWGAQAQLALALRRATATLGTPVPADVYRMLGTSLPLRVVLDAVDRLVPVERQRRDASPSRLVARAVRPGALRTVAQVARNAGQGVVDRLAPREGATVARVTAGEEALEIYLRAVEDSAGTGASPVSR
ncbi:nucleotidyltransferase domain-containing protein [Oceanitalea stevensii]|uniref:Nucleotidyltransferase family protein n=1 Tax=Oceanitalea stevensii TaxID=2763072 RepID=A0ABR8YZU2_9MICO|nr:nucleotidyltransferase family protein [Oceanitalea stevensii]MBD8061583.1 nucleotidyltransferase family protein [Oceanitalea stevensii]